MSDFSETLRLKGQAEEDIWFARRDRELLAARDAARASASPRRLPVRLVSGGQTGVDRAALDLALELGLGVGGWCPKGRRAADGEIPARYPLRETPSRRYSQRTAWNVRDSDATLILTRGEPAGGSALTARLAGRMGRPLLVVDLSQSPDPAAARRWVEAHRVRVLNVAGPRDAACPGIGDQARAFLRLLLAPAPEG